MIYNPSNGWEAYDKARNTEFIFNGAAWASAAGAFIGTAAATYTSTASLSGVYSTATLPTITGGDGLVSQSYTMKSATNRLRIRFTGSVQGSTTAETIIIAFFLNSNANALAASIVSVPGSSTYVPALLEYEFVPGTTSPFTIRVRAGCKSGGYSFNASAWGSASVSRLVLEEIVA